MKFTAFLGNIASVLFSTKFFLFTYIILSFYIQIILKVFINSAL